MNIFVTGWRGRLGSSLVELGCIPFVADITSENEIKQEMEKVSPGDCIINCAAKTGVDWCEKNYEDGALKVNSLGVRNLMLSLPNKVSFIQISTDYVFDGHKGPYKENDEPIHERFGTHKVTEPVNAYGWSKFGGEYPVYPLDSSQQGLYCVVRTTGLFGSVLPDLASYVVKKVHEKEELLVTDELIANQTYISNLAKNLILLASMDNKPSILHLASVDRMSRYRFAWNVAAKVFGHDKASKYIQPCNNSEVPNWVANRPTNSGLDCSKAVKLGFDLINIETGISRWYKDFGYEEFPA